MITSLLQSDWINKHQNQPINGPCGSGNLYRLCISALGLHESLPSEIYALVSISDNTIADAILDQLMHNAHRIKLKGESIQKNNPLLTDREYLR